MSLIADALKKAETSPDYRRKDVLPSFAPKNRPPQPPAWAYRLLLAASTALVLLAIARVARRPERPVPPVQSPAPVIQEIAGPAPEAPIPAAPAAPPQLPALEFPAAAVSSSHFASPVPGKQLVSRAERLSLNGIMLSGDGRPLALINQEVLQPGDRVRGMTVVQVKVDSVILQDRRGKTKTLKLKKGN